MRTIQEGAELAKRFEKHNLMLFNFCDGSSFLKSDGTIGYRKHESEYRPIDYYTRIEAIEVLTWENIKTLAIEENTYGFDGVFAIGLTYNNEVIVQDSDNRYPEVSKWKNIKDVFCAKLYNPFYFKYSEPRESWYTIAVTNDGEVLSCPEIPELSSWHNVSRIVRTHHDSVLFAITYDGRVLATGDVKNYEKKMISSWDGIKEIYRSSYQGAPVYGLTENGEILFAAFDELDYPKFPDIMTISNGIAIDYDGFTYPLDAHNVDLSRMLELHRYLGEGFIQASDGGAYGRYFLNIDGRVDYWGYYDDYRQDKKRIQRELISDKVSWLYGSAFLDEDGYIDYEKNRGDKRLFIGKPENYRIIKSNRLDDPITKDTIVKACEENKKRLSTEKSKAGLFNRGPYNEKIQEIDELLQRI